MAEYRNELKFLCSQAELEILRGRIAPIMRLDQNQGGQDYYNIRSLYFDDYKNSCYYENEAGVDKRKKYRIRIYNKNTSLIHLEVKYKEHSMTKKAHCDLDLETCLELMNGRLTFRKDFPMPLNMLYLDIKNYHMQPVEIVEYERCAFTYPIGNVRVTFDRNIAGTAKTHLFLEQRLPLVPVLMPNQHILEVKYDHFLPNFLAGVLDIGQLSRTTFSKYYFCRSTTLQV